MKHIHSLFAVTLLASSLAACNSGPSKPDDVAFIEKAIAAGESRGLGMLGGKVNSVKVTNLTCGEPETDRYSKDKIVPCRFTYEMSFQFSDGKQQTKERTREGRFKFSEGQWQFAS